MWDHSNVPSLDRQASSPSPNTTYTRMLRSGYRRATAGMPRTWPGPWKRHSCWPQSSRQYTEPLSEPMMTSTRPSPSTSAVTGPV